MDKNRFSPKIGLLSNFDTLGKNFQAYDIDAVNLESETDKYGKGAIDIAREYSKLVRRCLVKFYQGMLKQKGTKSAVDKLIRSKFDTISVMSHLRRMGNSNWFRMVLTL